MNRPSGILTLMALPGINEIRVAKDCSTVIIHINDYRQWPAYWRNCTRRVLQFSYAPEWKEQGLWELYRAYLKKFRMSITAFDGKHNKITIQGHDAKFFADSFCWEMIAMSKKMGVNEHAGNKRKTTIRKSNRGR